MTDVVKDILRAEYATQPLRDKVVYELASKLFDPKYIKSITDIKSSQMIGFFRLEMADKLFYQRFAKRNRKKYERLGTEFMKLLISQNRLGRSEIVTAYTKSDLESEVKGMRDRISDIARRGP